MGHIPCKHNVHRLEKQQGLIIRQHAQGSEIFVMRTNSAYCQAGRLLVVGLPDVAALQLLASLIAGSLFDVVPCLFLMGCARLASMQTLDIQ